MCSSDLALGLAMDNPLRDRLAGSARGGDARGEAAGDEEVVQFRRLAEDRLAHAAHDVLAEHDQLVGLAFVEAERLYRESLASDIKTFGPESQEAATMMNNFALTLEAAGKLEEASQLFEHALRIVRQRFSEDNARTMTHALNATRGFGARSEKNLLKMTPLVISQK